jgi:tetratricopeptide (TPR) repeat protein
VANDRARYEEALNRGHSNSWDQRWDEAIREFQVAVSEFPSEPAPYAGLGMAYFELNRLDKALENYKLAARYSQGDIIYLKQVAECQERLGRSVEAGQTYLAMGEIQLRRRLLDEAMGNWLRAARLAPDLLGAHQRLAGIYQRQGQTKAAIRELLAVARVLQKQGEAEKALQTCQVALSMDPRDPDVLTAIELIRQGEPLSVGDGLEAIAEAPAAPRDGAAIGAGLEGEAERAGRSEEGASPVQNARRMALVQLAEEIFEEGEEEEEGEIIPPGGMSKLERDALISQALDFETRGLINEAIRCYERAIQGGVTSTAAHFNLGLLYQDKLRFEDAIREFERAVGDPEYRLASHFALGESYRARGRIDRAVEHFVNVLKIVDLATVQHNQADRLIQLYENLAASLMTQGEPEKATAFANSLVDFLSHKGWQDKVREARTRLDALSAPGRTMILGDMLTVGSEKVLESLYLSQEYAKRGLYSSAVEETYRVIELAPDYLPGHLQLAELLLRQDRLELAAAKFITIGDTYKARGDINGAIGAYERVVDISPLDMTIRARLIDLLKRHGDIDRSIEHYIAMGNGYYQLAQVEKARETYQEGLKLAPRGSPERKWRSQLLRLIADIDMQRFDWRRALAAYMELQREAPADERTAMTLIDLYYKAGQDDNALRQLDQYLLQLVKIGKGVKVVGILEDMVSQRPQDPGLVFRLADIYDRQKRRQDAVTLLDHLAEAQLDSGQRDKALATIQRILRMNPANAASYQQLMQQIRR